MNHTLIVGIWACAITLGGAYGGVYWRQRASEPAAQSATAAHQPALETRLIKPITVPIIADGAVKGYISAEFNMLREKSDPHGEHAASLDPEGYFMDEAFRLIYSENKIDFSQMEKTDLAALTSHITANVNKRLGKEVVKETLVKSFAFIPRDELPH